MESASALPFNGFERPMVVKFFNPAYAEKSSLRSLLLDQLAVHPRLREELS